MNGASKGSKLLLPILNLESKGGLECQQRNTVTHVYLISDTGGPWGGWSCVEAQSGLPNASHHPPLSLLRPQKDKDLSCIKGRTRKKKKKHLIIFPVVICILLWLFACIDSIKMCIISMRRGWLELVIVPSCLCEQDYSPLIGGETVHIRREQETNFFAFFKAESVAVYTGVFILSICRISEDVKQTWI